MIGWRPYLLSLLALLILSVLVLDVAAVADRAGQVAESTESVLDAIQRWFSHFRVRDWALTVAAVSLVTWGWMRALASARLGTIDIGDLQTDGDTLAPRAAKAQLQKELAARGLLPPSAVPGGSPTVAGLSATVAEAPIPQAKFLASLLTLVPVPATSTTFRVTGTLSSSDTRVTLTYALDCVGPVRRVIVGDEQGLTASEAIERTAKAVYRHIAVEAPNIYPGWARWASIEALNKYHAAIEAERDGPRATDLPQSDETPGSLQGGASRYGRALLLYRQASELDPDNMLARIRAANCLERAATARLDERADRSVAALEAYVAVRLRQPTIFEAGFRASLLLSSLAETLPTDEDRLEALVTVLQRLELETARDVDAADHIEPGPLLTALWRWQKRLEMSKRRTPASVTMVPRSPGAVGHVLGRSIGVILERLGRDDERTLREPPDATQLQARLRRASQREARLARHRLRPWWTVIHEKRFRHRFEPTGRERRQLRKALLIARRGLAVRGYPDAGGQGTKEANRDSGQATSNPLQYCLRGYVFWRFIAGRSAVAGWQAHYNAACFYALLPQSSDLSNRGRARRVRNRALSHLQRALDDGEHQLACIYVRDEDSDLQSLRTLSPIRFENAIRRVCPAELSVHRRFAPDEPRRGLCARGEAIATPIRDAPTALLVPHHTTEGQIDYRIRIFDENRPLELWNNGEDHLVWTIVPSRVHGHEVWITSSAVAEPEPGCTDKPGLVLTDQDRKSAS